MCDRCDNASVLEVRVANFQCTRLRMDSQWWALVLGIM